MANAQAEGTVTIDHPDGSSDTHIFEAVISTKTEKDLAVLPLP